MTNALPRPIISFKDRQEAQDKFNEQRAERFDMAAEFFGRQLSQALGRVYFKDLTPGEQKHVYGLYPPELVDGSVPPWAGGPWDWPLIQAEFPKEYEYHVQRYHELLRGEIRKQGAAA